MYALSYPTLKFFINLILPRKPNIPPNNRVTSHKSTIKPLKTSKLLEKPSHHQHKPYNIEKKFILIKNILFLQSSSK